MISINIRCNFWGLILKCNEQDRRLFEFIIIVVDAIILFTLCRFVRTAVLPHETQGGKDYLEKKSHDVAEKVRRYFCSYIALYKS